uniref:ribonucleoside-diphosphate reductase n=1 Tax=viral metagenome TaxID=1070528 RepID=A0A6C0H923_9ZZZZ
MNTGDETSIDMRVTKRDGELEDIAFDKILNRVKKLGLEANIQINYSSLVMKVIDQLYDKIPTTKIDELTAEQCAVMSTQHPDYAVLAGRVVVSNHQKNTDASFYKVMEKLYWYNDVHGKHSPLLSHETWLTICANKDDLEGMIDYNRDYLIDYFGFKTLERAYLFKVKDVVVERPQHMWMRVAVGIHGNNMDAVRETYDLMSQKYFTHATPTLFNAGTPRPQLSSCYLIAMEDDSIDGIYNTLKDCAKISKWAGGIGLHIHNVRAKGTHIRGTNGKSNGIVPMLRVFNNTAKYVDQCVHPETIIYTTNGPTQIQNCSVGETKIYNLKGETETIQNVLEHNYSGDFLEIESMHSIFPLRITPEHPIYVLKNQPKGLNYSLIKNRIQKNICKFEWVDAKDVNNTDWLIFPIPTEVNDITNITEEDCYMYGIILGDGSMNNDDTRSGTITIHTFNKAHLKDFIVSYFERNYVNYNIRVDENTTKIRWNRSIHLPFRYNDFYDDNKRKRVNHKWLNLPVQKCKYILKGLLQTDGCYGKKELVFDNTSLNLIECVRFICMKMGMLTSGYIRDRVGEKHETTRGIIENKKISYTLRVPKTKEICELMDIEYDDEKQFFKFLRYGDYLLSRVQNVKTTKYEGILYDLQMEKEHNYLIHNGLIHNGGGRRNGSFAIYLETWHADIEDFLDMRKNHGDEELRARDLFYALWVSDLFMERVKENGKWSLFCPHECPGLADVYGDEFKELYMKYESQITNSRVVNARELWFKILDAQMETGTPYLLYKDAANIKSNQKNIGTIKSSNLCTEILEYSDDKETAVCNLASIALPAFVNQETKEFNYEELHRVTKVVTGNLNRIIDINFYPTEKTKRSNMLHRPIGIGVQGLADVFILMDIPFHSEAAKEVNKMIFETIYHAALEKSNDVAGSRKELVKHIRSKLSTEHMEKIRQSLKLEQTITDYPDLSSLLGQLFYNNAMNQNVVVAEILNIKKDELCGSYSSFEGSPASKGQLQFDLWGVDPATTRYNWKELRDSIQKYGLRNSLLLAPMPTASTSQILGYNECFEPLTSNLYTRRTLAGEFVVANKYLMKDLISLGLWNEKIKNNIIANKGSIQQLTVLPEHIREKYKIVWEMPMKHLIDMAADRGAFICQSQSLNLWLEDPNYNTLTSMHFYSWKKGLKTGIYYLRRKAKHQAQQFTLEPDKKDHGTENDEICEMCSA